MVADTDETAPLNCFRSTKVTEHYIRVFHFVSYRSLHPEIKAVTAASALVGRLP